MSAKEKYLQLKSNPQTTQKEWVDFIQEYSIYPFNVKQGIPEREPGLYSNNFINPTISNPPCSYCHHKVKEKSVCRNKSKMCIKGNYIVDIPDVFYQPNNYNFNYEMSTGY